MADKKITQLDALLIADGVDLLPIVDITTTQTKKITISSLMASPGPIGNFTASTGEFTTLQLPTGVTVNEFSSNTSLGSSDTAIPTQNAVKTYVDSQAGTSVHNDLSGLQGGDATTSEYYHLTEDIYNGLFSGSPIIGLGNDAATHFKVDYGTGSIAGSIAGTQEFGIDSNGISLKLGSTVNNISTDVNLGTSNNTLVTQNAIKTYINTVVANEDNVRRISSDATASVLDVLLVDTTEGNIEVTIETSANGRISIKKIASDTNTITINCTSGTIDGENEYIFDTPNQAYTFIVDEGDVFIL